ncbi:MAG: hypothetical protein AB8H80_07040 [Planctomycetota bacterium]
MCGSLLLAEVGLRTVAWAAGRPRGIHYDPDLGWRMVADLTKSGELWSNKTPCQTNSSGWRDAPFLPKRPGHRRILALGDSMTFGANVDYGERFTELLEDERTDVLNMGVCAYGPDQHVLVYEHEGHRYGADIVLLQITHYNDLEDLRCARKAGWSKPYFTMADDEPGASALQLNRRSGFSSWPEQLRSSCYIAELAMQLLERNRPAAEHAAAWRDDGDSGPATAPDTVPLFAALVERLDRAVTQDGAKLLVVFESNRDDEPASITRGNERMQAAVQRAGIQSFVLQLAAGGASDAELFLPCGHWSPAAQRIVAAQLNAEFERRGW